MNGTGSRRIAWVSASLAAGPVYLAARSAGAFLDMLPQPVLITPAAAVGFFLGLIPAIIGGFFAAMVPLGVAIASMAALARCWPLLRAPPLWAAAGAAAGALIAFVLQTDEWGPAFALVCTGAVSLRLARAFLDFPSLQQLPSIRRSFADPHFSKDLS
jgi:hypothetical protein